MSYGIRVQRTAQMNFFTSKRLEMFNKLCYEDSMSFLRCLLKSLKTMKIKGHIKELPRTLMELSDRTQRRMIKLINSPHKNSMV